MARDIFEEVSISPDEVRKVNLDRRQEIDADALTSNQTRNKNKYVKKIRDLIMAGREFGEEDEYMSFKHNEKIYYLKRKTKKPFVPKTIHYRESKAMEHKMTKNKSLSQRILELEAENSVLRNKAIVQDEHYPTLGNRPESFQICQKYSLKYWSSIQR